MTVRVVAFITARPEGHERVLEVLREDAAAASREPGNGRFEFYVHPEDPNRIVLVEEWLTEAALDEHRVHEHTEAVVAALTDPTLVEALVPWRFDEDDEEVGS